jgi:predicted RNase H-like HicB family nuclease
MRPRWTMLRSGRLVRVCYSSIQTSRRMNFAARQGPRKRQEPLLVVTRHKPETKARKPAVKPSLQRTITAVIRPGQDGYYVAECTNIAAVTQGKTVQETLDNLREVVAVHLEGEDLASLGLAPDPVIVVTMELEPAGAKA